ncbi:MAG: hypothetical protein HDKAJFGB_02133 [Anaerolineae bacterium]|nr:hypothetical protein [Anaerolineae bacterium]
MGQIPQDERAGALRGGGDGLHVVHRAALERGVRQRDERALRRVYRVNDRLRRNRKVV